MTNEVRRPKVGVGTFVFKGNHFLLGLRKGSHGSNTWALPGGHLEWFETFEDTALREIQEETDLQVDNITFITATNDIFEKEDKHYATIFMACNWVSGEPKNMEPNKCLEWCWFEWGSVLPNNIFMPPAKFLKMGIGPRQYLKTA